MRISYIVRPLWAVAMLAATTACVSTNATLLDVAATARRAPVPADQVKLYRLATQVPGRYEEIALINAASASQYTSEQKMLESMRKKAGSVGANGVILEGISEPGAGAKVAAAVFGTATERKGKAIAIYVFPDSTGAAAR